MICNYRLHYYGETASPTARLKLEAGYCGSTPPLICPAFKLKEAFVCKHQPAQGGGLKSNAKLIICIW